MYSEYTTRFTHSMQFMCILYNLYCIVHIDYTDSQLYFDIILHYIYRMCVKKMCCMLNVQCTLYILHIYAQYAFLFTLAGPTDFARISKITTRQT